MMNHNMMDNLIQKHLITNLKDQILEKYRKTELLNILCLNIL